MGAVPVGVTVLSLGNEPSAGGSANNLVVKISCGTISKQREYEPLFETFRYSRFAMTNIQNHGIINKDECDWFRARIMRKKMNSESSSSTSDEEDTNDTVFQFEWGRHRTRDVLLQ